MSSQKQNIFRVILFLLFLGFTAGPVFAHEQYVLTNKELTQGMQDHTQNVLTALQNPENVRISLFVGIGITITLIGYFFFQFSPFGKTLHRILVRFDPLGHLLLRIALAGSLLASASFHSFLGPEIPLTSIAGGNFLIPVLFCCGLLLLFGIFTRVAAGLGLLILLLTTSVYGEYMLTYFNYFGEFIALLFLGSYSFSLDNQIFGPSSLVKKYKEIELLIIRVTYGISVLYPAITIKLFHPDVIVIIVNKYHMNQIHWLFPQDPLLISLGTGMAQILVGMLIIFGLETRLASFATFLLYLLSVLFFKEAVWPHYVLLALALYLVINNGGELTLDTVISKFLDKKIASSKRFRKQKSKRK